MANAKIEANKIKERYESITTIWDMADQWHYKTMIEIEHFIRKLVAKNNLSDSYIINLGSAGNSYSFNDDNVLHVDIVKEKIKEKKNYIVSNIEDINISESFEGALCVGSVINYCDPFLAIKECARLIKRDGFLILEFENSKSLEFIFSKHYNQNISFVDTFYQNSPEQVFIYSEKFIKNILKEYGFKVLLTRRFHIISPMFLLKTNSNSNKASRFIYWDSFFRKVPFFKNHSSNVILYAIKI